MDGNAARTKRWRRLEYERLVDLGAFPPGDRLELVAGELLVREPQGSPHATAIRSAQEALRAAQQSGDVAGPHEAQCEYRADEVQCECLHVFVG